MNKSTSVYLVGYDEEDAWNSLIFDSYESATSYQADNPGKKLYQASALIRRDTMELIDDEEWRCDKCGRTAEEVDVNPNGIHGMCRECSPDDDEYA